MSSDQPPSTFDSSANDGSDTRDPSAFQAGNPATVDELSRRPVESTSETKPRLWTVFLTMASATMAYLVVSTVCLVVAIAVTAATLGGDASKRSAEELMNVVFTQPASVIFLLVPAHIAILAISIFAAVLSPSPFASRLSLTRPSWPWWATVAAVLAAPFGSFLWSIVLSQFIESNQYMEMMVTMFRSTTDGFGIGVSLLCIAALPAFSEEWLFRGYVQTRLAQRWSPWLAILVSGLLFAVFHLEPLHVLAVFPIGLWFGYISWRSGSIIPAMLAHAYNNALSLIGVVYDQTDALDASMASFSNQVIVFLGLPGLLVIFGYLIASRSSSQTIATNVG